MFDRKLFWLDPDNSGADPGMIMTCRPEFYLDLENVTRMNVETLEKYTEPTDSILEIGCGTGRNLVALHRLGYEKLAGIDLSQKAVNIGRAMFGGYAEIPVTIAAVEDVIKDIEPVDVIFTSGMLMHLPPDLEWVFDVIQEKAQKVIQTVEGEIYGNVHAWPRNYGAVFANGVWTEAEMETCEKYPPLPESTIKRVFVKQEKPKRAGRRKQSPAEG